MAEQILWVIGALALILFSAELFVNAIEWLGAKLKLAEGAVGSVLAATGTALPETIIPVVAIIADVVSGRLGTPQAQSQSVGVGAIVGAPFMLGTLAFFLVGFTFFLARKRGRTKPFDVSGDVIRHDLEFFILAFGLGCGAGVLNHFLHLPKLALYILAAVLILIYILYLRKVLKAGGVVTHENLAPLHLLHRIPVGDAHNPRRRFIALQLLLSLTLMFVGAHVFVDHFNELATAFGIPALILALLIVPVATELPEKFNTILWVNRGKDTLAMGNISGAMVFQSTFPISLGLIFLNWKFDPQDPAVISAGLGILGAIVVLFGLRKTNEVDPKALLTGGILWLIFVVLVVLQNNGLIDFFHITALPHH
jgi:cation:H+ antiporter